MGASGAAAPAQAGGGGPEQVPISDVAAAPRPATTAAPAPAAADLPAAAPPPAVRGIIDKLVAYMQKHGGRFEAVVRAREAANPAFGFLWPASSHHADRKSVV